VSDDRSVLIVANSADPAEVMAGGVHDVVIAVDGGLGAAVAAGRSVDVIVGDMDSVDPDQRRACAAREVVARPDKDETDLELALAEAAALGGRTIHVVAASGGRLDHAVANTAVLASPRWRDRCVSASIGRARLWVVHDCTVLPLEEGSTVGLQAIGGPAVVSTEGLAYPLHRESLDPFGGRGVANVVRSAPAVVTVDAGVVVALSGSTH